MKLFSLHKKNLLPVLLMMASLTGMAQTTFTVGDLNYQVNDDGVSVTLTGHVSGQGATGTLNIPESVNYQGNDYAVTVIGNSAFLYGFFTGNLVIPNSVTTIEDGAFAYCYSFTGDLVIPNSVTTIGESAFQICYGFDGDLIIGNSVTTIGDYAFNDCNGLHGVLNIPSNVESIGTSTFRYCAFSGMTVDPDNPVFDSRDNCNAIIKTSTNELLSGCVNTVIPNTVTSIGENAFCGLEGLTSIDIPNSITSIGDGAFSFCFQLTGDLTIPNSVETIGAGAFFQCSGFNGTLTIGESVNFIGDYAFRQCSNFTNAVSLATTPPELGNEPGWNCVVFQYFGTPILTVPCGCDEAYQNSAWYDPVGMNGFYVFDEDCSVQNPLLKSHWTQDYPYNQLCPRDPMTNYSYSYAGCPAIAMGQIINYLRTTQDTRFSDSDDYVHNYAGRNYTIDDDWKTLLFPSFPQLNVLLDSADAAFQRGEELSDSLAAAVVFACGTACTQVYTSQGSGTFTVDQAFAAYQRFGFTDCVLYRDPCDEMYATLISNLLAGYPAHLAVEDPAGTVGHNVVVDGYRESDGKFHINFGYGGTLDDWYDIPDPNFYYGMTKVEGIILNIIPTATAVPESYCQQSLEVYPNPVSDVLYLKDLPCKQADYAIFNVLGQKVASGSTCGIIPVAELAHGVYVLQVKDEEVQKTAKFVVK